MSAITDQSTYRIDDRVPVRKAILSAAQHVLAMFGATVLGPLLMGFDTNRAIVLSGFATIVFWYIVKGRIPSYLGSSFAFIAVVTTLTNYSATAGGPNQHLSVGLGAVITTGFAYLLIALIVLVTNTLWLGALLPPIVTGSIVVTIGLNLAPVAADQIFHSVPFDAFIGCFTVIAVAASAVYIKSGFYRLIPVFIGAIISIFVYFVGSNIFGLSEPISARSLTQAPLFGFPQLFPVLPSFSIQTIFSAAPIALILVAENLGHIRAIAALDDPDHPQALDSYIGRAFLADALATIISGSAGGTGLTTYAENIGVMSITKVYASRVFRLSGLMAIILGCSPKFGECIKLIPKPIIGGLSFIVFALIVAAGLRIFVTGKVDMKRQTNAIVAGVTLAIASAGLSLSVGYVNLGAIGTASLASVALYHILKFADLDEEESAA